MRWSGFIVPLITPQQVGHDETTPSIWMSWSTRTWEPRIRRDGPLLAVATFFVAPCAFFLVMWYTQYLSGLSTTPVIASLGALVVLIPPLICYRLARRAGRRGALWFIIVLAGMILAHWLPARYLVLGGSLPSGAHVVLPNLARQALAATLVSLVPLVMGMIPVIVYGLAIGLDRPLAGTPPRGAVMLVAAAGTILWIVVLFASLLNPTPPLFAVTAEQVEYVVNVSRPPALSAQVEESTWEALLWRLHDGAPPGATAVRASEDEGVHMQLPETVQSSAVLELLMGPGVIEFVDAGDAPPAAGTEVSTSSRSIAAADFAFDTVLAGDDVILEQHWSGIASRTVELVVQDDDPIMMVHLNDEGLAKLRRYSEENQGDFLALVLDNTVILSFPVRSSIDSHVLTIRRLEPDWARPIMAILRYGSLPLTPTVEPVDSEAP